MRKKSVLAGIGILFAVLLTFIWGIPCVLEEIEAAQLPRASQKTFQMNPLASYDFSADVEAYRNPAITKTNHMLKLEYLSGEVRSTYYTDEKQEAFTFSRTAESEYTGELLVMRFEIKENLSESELKQGDTLWLATFETDAVKLFEKTKTVYLPLPVRRLNRDDVMPIDGTTYYCFPSEYDLFFVLNGKVYPYRDITYEEQFETAQTDLFEGYGNPYGKYRGMETGKFESEIRSELNITK